MRIQDLDQILDQVDLDSRLKSIHKNLHILGRKEMSSGLVDSLKKLARYFQEINSQRERVNQALEGRYGDPWVELERLNMMPEKLVSEIPGRLPSGLIDELSPLGRAFVRAVDILEGIYSLLEPRIWRLIDPYQSMDGITEENIKRGCKEISSKLRLEIEGLLCRETISQEMRENQLILRLPEDAVRQHAPANFFIRVLYPPGVDDCPQFVDESNLVEVPVAYGVLLAFKQLYVERLHAVVLKLENEEAVWSAEAKRGHLTRIKAHLSEGEHSHLKRRIQQILESAPVEQDDVDAEISKTWSDELNKVKIPNQSEVRERLRELVENCNWEIQYPNRKHKQLADIDKKVDVKKLFREKSFWTKQFKVSGLKSIPPAKPWEQQRSAKNKNKLRNPV